MAMITLGLELMAMGVDMAKSLDARNQTHLFETDFNPRDTTELKVSFFSICINILPGPYRYRICFGY